MMWRPANRLMRVAVRRSCLSSNVTEPLPTAKDIKLAILGGGKMSEAIIGALQQKSVQTMKNVVVCDVQQERLAYLKTKYGVSITEDAKEAVRDAEVTFLAVKPQNIPVLVEYMSGTPVPGLLLSICAGVALGDLQRSFHSQKIVRSMPNTAAMIQEGITVWMATPETSPEMRSVAQFLLQCFGEEMEVFEEKYLDMATAVSGSGPAYVFLAMEAMIDAGVHLGFQREVASRLVIATIRGSAAYAQQSGEHVTKLKNDVTSPSGTTASALYELEKGGFRTVMADAIWSAYRRSLELGGKSSNVGPGRSKERR
jgi:pyrroline-5-carboxylate reductase